MSTLSTVAKITLDNSHFKKGLADAQEAGSKFGSAIKGTAKVAAAAMTAVTTAVVGVSKSLADGIKETAEYGDNVDKMSQKMGLSTEAYQEWDFVMQHCGTTIEGMKPAMKTLATQAESDSKAFEKLGLSQEEIANMSQEELFGATISALQEMDDETQRTAIAGQLLGRGATELGALLNMSAEETANMKQQVHDLGGVMSEDAVKSSAAYKDSLQNLQTSIGGLKRGLMADFLPSVVTVMDGLTEIFSGDSESGLKKIEEGVNGFTEQLNTVIPKIIEIGGQIATSLVTAIVDTLPTLLTSLITATTTLINGIIENIPQIINAVLQVAPQLFEAALMLLVALGQGIGENLPELIPSIVQIILEMVTILFENIPLLIDAAKQLLFGLIYGLALATPDLLLSIGGIIASLLKAVYEFLNIGSLVETGKNLIKGLWNGILDVKEWLLNKIHGFVDTITDGIKDFFGIASPSKLFEDQVGKNLALGIGVGFTTNMDEVEADMQNALPSTLDVAAGVTTTIGSSPLSDGIDELIEMFKYGTAKTSIDNTRDLRRAINA